MSEIKDESTWFDDDTIHALIYTIYKILIASSPPKPNIWDANERDKASFLMCGLRFWQTFQWKMKQATPKSNVKLWNIIYLHHLLNICKHYN